ncbi:MAG: hypothetical protein IJF71_06315, partial [Clostridia bacterium]|nr:hypothetical protein [Clostridia bacterium]
MLKKTICCAITGIIMMSCLSGCGNPGDNPQGGVEVNTKTYNLPAISYMQSQTEKTYDDEFITVTIPTKDSFSVGEKIDVASKIKATKIWKRKDNEITAGAVYFVCDWGDGTWSYNGPGLQNDSTKSTVVNSHVYNQPGTYYISVAAFNMQTEEQIGWSEGKKIVIEGEQKQREGLLTELQPISSPSFGKSYNAEQVTDGDEKTYFKSTVAQEATEEQYVGYLFNDNYTLDHLEVQIPSDTEIFPCNIAIEYTSDYGKSWQSLPKYYYLYTNSEGIFTPLMNFPNPKGATLSLGLDGIVANGIRIVSKLTNVSLDMLAKDKYFTVSEMRVYGNRRTTFYTSLGNTFDADLNNMWTIFGSAKTEPNLTGNQLSSATNGSPFRTGHTIIGSTEWLQWNGLKFNWTDYDAAKSTYYNFLKNTRTGPDGWSQDDGYIWATANGQYHLDM